MTVAESNIKPNGAKSAPFDIPNSKYPPSRCRRRSANWQRRAPPRRSSMINIDQLDRAGNKVCAWCFVPEGNLAAGRLHVGAEDRTGEVRNQGFSDCQPQ
jgi:hypothetical protein